MNGETIREKLIRQCKEGDLHGLQDTLVIFRQHILSDRFDTATGKTSFITLKDSDGTSPIHHAIKQDNAEIVRLLLQNGFDPNEEDRMGETALHKAVHKGSRNIVEMLLTSEANLEHRDTTNGDTPLLIACRENNHELVDLLLTAGANPAICNDKSYTPLHRTLYNRDDKAAALIVDFLIRAGAKPDEQDRYGSTPLHDAALYGMEKTSLRFIAANANPTIQDCGKKTAKELAAGQGFVDIEKHIAQHEETFRIERQKKRIRHQQTAMRSFRR